MIAMSLAEIAGVTGGELVGGPDDVVIDGAVVVDSREAGPGSLFVAIAGDHVDGHDFAASAVALGARAVLGTRPVDAPTIVVDDPVVAVGLLAAEVLRRLRTSGNPRVVAITGSSGKTSVKDMTAHVLAAFGSTIAARGSQNNELGVPLTILRADRETRHLVLEMGARGIGHIATLCAIAPPDVSAVLNIGSAHAGEFGGLANTARAKGEIVEALGADGTAVLNADDPRSAGLADSTAARVLTFGETGEIRLSHVHTDEQGRAAFELTVAGVTRSVTVPQLGVHQAPNAAAAVAVAIALGLDDLDAVVGSLATAEAVSPMRMQRQVRADGLVVINDAYNANPDSMAAALRTLAEVAGSRSVAVLGEMLELGPDGPAAHAAIGRLAADLRISRVVAVGEAARPIAAAAGAIGEAYPDTDAAARTLVADLGPGDTVLVKASRGARLERVADALLAAAGHERKERQDPCLPS